MLVVIYQIGDKIATDLFTHEAARAFNKGGFIEIKQGNETIASYNPDKLVCIKKLPEHQEKAILEKMANDDPTEAMHTGDRPEGREDSSDR